MKKIFLISLMTVLSSYFTLSCGEGRGEVSHLLPDTIVAFPGAEGFGKYIPVLRKVPFVGRYNNIPVSR